MSKVTAITNKVSRNANKIAFGIKKRSPEILVFAGITSVVAGAVWACRSTLKASQIIDEAKDTVEKIQETAESAKEDETIGYTPEDEKKDMTIVYTQTGLRLVKLYAPAVALGVLGIGCVLKSHNIIKKRNLALAAAYATVDKGFKEYRNRVIERFGEDMDRELKYNLKTKEFEETVVDEKGKEKTVKVARDVVGDTLDSPYARLFESGNPNWNRNATYNLQFLRAQESYACDLLVSKGYVYLNEVYDMLDLPWSKAGQIVGWVYDDKNPTGDNFVDFGIREVKKELPDGTYENAFLLDFNVDGNILSSMGEDGGFERRTA